MEINIRKDIFLILTVSIVSAVLYIVFGDLIMDYGRNGEYPLFLRFLPVLLIQFGMSCLGVLIVLAKNKEKFCEHGLIRKNALLSVAGCLLSAVPTVLVLWLTDDIHTFFPFQGMFLTKDILAAPFPMNVFGYLLIAVVWGFGEGLFYVILSDKINCIKKPRGILNTGALACAVISILIHGMIGFDGKTILEPAATFILMYGSVLIYNRTENAWGNILIFFVIWNAW